MVPWVKLIIPTVARADLAYWLASATIQLERRIPLIAVATENGETVCGKYLTHNYTIMIQDP